MTLQSILSTSYEVLVSPDTHIVLNIIRWFLVPLFGYLSGKFGIYLKKRACSESARQFFNHSISVGTVLVYLFGLLVLGVGSMIGYLSLNANFSLGDLFNTPWSNEVWARNTEGMKFGISVMAIGLGFATFIHQLWTRSKNSQAPKTQSNPQDFSEQDQHKGVGVLRIGRIQKDDHPNKEILLCLLPDLTTELSCGEYAEIPLEAGRHNIFAQLNRGEQFRDFTIRPGEITDLIVWATKTKSKKSPNIHFQEGFE